MPETFPTTPPTPRAVRLCAFGIGLVGVIFATTTTITSVGWIGRVFPGFVLLDNRVVASVSLAHWSGARIPDLYQSEVLAVDGVDVRTSEDVYRAAASRPPGTLLHYRLRRRGVDRDVEIATERFTGRDWALLFFSYLLNAIVYLASGLVVWVLRPSAPLSRALLALGGTGALFFLTAMQAYDPGNLFRLHILGETLLAAAILHVAMLFPQPHPHARLRFLGYAVSLAILVPYQVFLYRPAVYSLTLAADMGYLGLVAIFFAWRLVSEYWRGRSPLARQRVRIVTLGTLFTFALPGTLVLVSALYGGALPINLGASTSILFIVALAYAVVKHDLFDIDAMVKRGAYYLMLTGAVGALYVGAVLVFNLILEASEVTDSAAFPILFTLAVLLLFNPLRTRLQAFVDRVFFRTQYDGAQVLANVGGALANAVKREDIASIVTDAVRQAIPNERTRLFLSTRDDAFVETGGGGVVPPAVAARLRAGSLATVFDPPELYADAAVHESVRTGLASLEAEVALPLRRGDDLIGVLTVGPKRSGLFYTAGDAEFLRALAHQATTALENARTYEALVALNARLEERVRERTAQIEAANRELAEAYRELKLAETQLVQSEKMASLGRLVAGVAHEINNPVSFIASNVAPLRRRLARAAQLAPAEAQKVLHEAEDIADIMGRGAERTAAIVKDLRTFSRLGEAARKPVDVQEGLEVSLRLLESRWRDRITVHRDYVPLPPVEGDPGQLNQVFMNLLANACDAIATEGNIWLTTRVEGDTVRVTVRDDGVGMPPDVQGRIFEPFFTTKDVGGGTGLGLAISHSVVTGHGGRIEVESAPRRGTCFRIVLPVVAPAAAGQVAGAMGERG